MKPELEPTRFEKLFDNGIEEFRYERIANWYDLFISHQVNHLVLVRRKNIAPESIEMSKRNVKGSFENMKETIRDERLPSKIIKRMYRNKIKMQMKLLIGEMYGYYPCLECDFFAGFNLEKFCKINNYDLREGLLALCPDYKGEKEVYDFKELIEDLRWLNGLRDRIDNKIENAFPSF